VKYPPFVFGYLVPLFFAIWVKPPSHEQLSVFAPSILPGGDLFDSDDVITLRLSGNLKAVLTDRGDSPQYHPLKLSYYKKDSTQVTLDVDVKARGHFRKLRSNCDYPPLLLNFTKSNPKSGSLFYKQQKLKLVMPCVSDEYVVREWLVYKIYNLLTPESFRARLVKVILDDASRKKQSDLYGILLEDETQMASRNNMTIIERKLNPQSIELSGFLTMAVFQYMIGNTDWSVPYQQNIKLLLAPGNPKPTTVPYDFDHSGLVNAPYAHPAEELELKSVMERRYRGYCITDMKMFDGVISLFNRSKNDIYSLYSRSALLDAKYVRNTTKYLDEFYDTINNPKKMKEAFSYPCDPNGTGNVIIKGLKSD
jgi:hypothetical protein